MALSLIVLSFGAPLTGCSRDEAEAPTTAEALNAAATRNREQGGPDWPDPPADGCPASAQFLEILQDDGQLRGKLRLFNFGDKEIVLLRFNLQYLDKAGTELKVFPWNATPSLPARSHAYHVVGAFLPPETARVEATVELARFADGTEWKRAKSR